MWTHGNFCFRLELSCIQPASMLSVAPISILLLLIRLNIKVFHLHIYYGIRKVKIMFPLFHVQKAEVSWCLLNNFSGNFIRVYMADLKSNFLQGEFHPISNADNCICIFKISNNIKEIYFFGGLHLLKRKTLIHGMRTDRELDLHAAQPWLAEKKLASVLFSIDCPYVGVCGVVS